jgi:hypothetical protein
VKAICSDAGSDHIINMRHELVQLASRLDWDWIDREIAPLYSDKGRPGIEILCVTAQARLRLIRRGRVRALVS